MELNCLVAKSRPYERAYLAWETVRLVRNPFFITGTGFEGYFVGICQSADEMQRALLETGREVLATLKRMMPCDHLLYGRMMYALTGDSGDAQAVGTWATLLGTTLGKLRRNTALCQAARDFQSETYRSVYQLPPMRYTHCGPQIRQTYSLSPYWKQYAPKPVLRLGDVKPEDQDAALVMATLGNFGHPLLRAHLLASTPTWWRGC